MFVKPRLQRIRRFAALSQWNGVEVPCAAGNVGQPPQEIEQAARCRSLLFPRGSLPFNRLRNTGTQ